MQNHNANQQTVSYRVKESHAGLPIDISIRQQVEHISRKTIRKILDMGGITLNDKRVRKGSQTLRLGDRVAITIFQDSVAAWSKRQFTIMAKDILYHQHGLVAFNKPPLLASQACRGKSVPHVVSLLEAYFQKRGEACSSLALCHRLDKETSGLLLTASNRESLDWVMRQFKEKSVRKVYLALCFGIPQATEWSVSCCLSPIDKKTGLVRKVLSGGKPSLTHFKVLETFPREGLALLACYPQTGRGHQIRVHLELSAHPLVGDKKYGEKSRRPLPPGLAKLAAIHHFLHAYELTFSPSPGIEVRHLKAPLSPYFTSILKALYSKHLASL